MLGRDQLLSALIEKLEEIENEEKDGENKKLGVNDARRVVDAVLARGPIVADAYAAFSPAVGLLGDGGLAQAFASPGWRATKVEDADSNFNAVFEHRGYNLVQSVEPPRKRGPWAGRETRF